MCAKRCDQRQAAGHMSGKTTAGPVSAASVSFRPNSKFKLCDPLAPYHPVCGTVLNQTTHITRNLPTQEKYKSEPTKNRDASSKRRPGAANHRARPERHGGAA